LARVLELVSRVWEGFMTDLLGLEIFEIDLQGWEGMKTDLKELGRVQD